MADIVLFTRREPNVFGFLGSVYSLIYGGESSLETQEQEEAHERIVKVKRKNY